MTLSPRKDIAAAITVRLARAFRAFLWSECLSLKNRGHMQSYKYDD